MKNILFYFKVIFFKSLLVLNISFAENKFDLRLGSGIIQSSYQIKTSANSILKWDNIKIFNTFMNLNYNYTNRTAFVLDINYGMVLSGVMTDDDMANSINPTCAAFLCSAVYSRTKDIKGTTTTIDFLMKSVVNTFEVSEFSVISGFTYKNFFYKPKGIYQMVINVQPAGATGATNVSDIELQYTNLKVFGPTIGIGFKRETGYLNFETSLLTFIALYGKSSQTKWGYDWFIKDGAGKIFGIDFNFNIDIRTSENMWFGIGANISYLQGQGLTECGTKQSSVCYGSIKSLNHLKTGINLNLKFK